MHDAQWVRSKRIYTLKLARELTFRPLMVVLIFSASVTVDHRAWVSLLTYAEV